jgi:hypothetical protein
VVKGGEMAEQVDLEHQQCRKQFEHLVIEEVWPSRQGGYMAWHVV